jgi:prolyl-tRNA synthetase
MRLFATVTTMVVLALCQAVPDREAPGGTRPAVARESASGGQVAGQVVLDESSRWRMAALWDTPVYRDADGNEKPIVMGSYGIGSGRLLACVAEGHHDERGLILPIPVAPYHVHLVSLAGNDAAITDAAERIYRALLAAKVEVLYDDRAESPGVKFADADLIGLPIRLTVSGKSLRAGGVEMKRRDQKEIAIVAESDLIARVQAEIKMLFDEIAARVVEVPFR